MSYLSVEQLDMSFTRGKVSSQVLKGINLRIDQGEFISIIGHSGCGKSTVLNIIAGLLEPSIGVVILDGKEVNGPGPDRGMVFQNHSLLPWLTVFENVEVAVNKVFKRSMSKAERRDWIEHNLKLVSMGHALDKYPQEISGGMKHRVGIARALAMKPKVLLLDEPFGALDEIVRDHLNEQLLQLWTRTAKTVVFVTHSIPEAVFLSTRIVVMSPRPGRIHDIIRSDLPRDRDLSIRETPEFLHLAQRVRDGLRAGHSYDEVA